jgi:beta-N-acetylhexosaminidase
MFVVSRRRSWRSASTAAALALVVAGCASSPAPDPGPTATGSPTASPSSSASSPTPPTTSPSPAGSCTPAQALASWPLQRLASQVVVVPVQLDDIAAATPEVRAGVGGVILFGRTVPADLAVRLAALRAAAPAGLPPFVMADEEGGAVQRLRGLVGPVPSARDLAASTTPAGIESLAARIGRAMRAAGVTMDLAPVLDLDDGPGPDAEHPDGTRSYGTDPDRTAADGLAFADGLRAAGVVPVVKHFPGLGGATGNTDDEAASTLPWATLRQSGLRPFLTAVRHGVPAVMVGNASVPGLTYLPASISHEVVTDVLRDQLGFHGLVVTDSLSARALVAAGYPVPRAVAWAIGAGADLTLFDASPGDVPATTRGAVDAVVDAVTTGQLPRSRLVDAVAHVLAAKGVDPCGLAS